MSTTRVESLPSLFAFRRWRAMLKERYICAVGWVCDTPPGLQCLVPTPQHFTRVLFTAVVQIGQQQVRFFEERIEGKTVLIGGLGLRKFASTPGVPGLFHSISTPW